MSSRSPRSFLWIELLLLWSAVAWAAPKDEYSRGVQLYQAGQYEDAIDAFREAYQQKPRALILFNIAQAFRKDQKPASALEHYQRFLSEVKPGEEPASQANAKKYIAEIEAQLAVASKPSPAPVAEVAPPPPIAVVSVPPPPVATPVVADKPAKQPVYKKWWLWTAVGVAAAAVIVGVGAGVGTRSSNNDPSTALGTRQPVY
jgi:hypothetical protein